MNLETRTTADPSQDQPKKIFNRCFVSIFLANSLMYLSQWMVNSLVAKYAGLSGGNGLNGWHRIQCLCPDGALDSRLYQDRLWTFITAGLF